MVTGTCFISIRTVSVGTSIGIGLAMTSIGMAVSLSLVTGGNKGNVRRLIVACDLSKPTAEHSSDFI